VRVGNDHTDVPHSLVMITEFQAEQGTWLGGTARMGHGGGKSSTPSQNASRV
jgi:hypothetical protein